MLPNEGLPLPTCYPSPSQGKGFPHPRERLPPPKGRVSPTQGKGFLHPGEGLPPPRGRASPSQGKGFPHPGERLPPRRGKGSGEIFFITAGLTLFSNGLAIRVPREICGASVMVFTDSGKIPGPRPGLERALDLRLHRYPSAPGRRLCPVARWDVSSCLSSILFLQEIRDW